MSTSFVPVAVDWDSVDGDYVQNALLAFESMCKGRGNPSLPLVPTFKPDETQPYLLNACGIVRWAILMCGGLPAPEAIVYDDVSASHVCVDRIFYFWQMYKRYHVFQIVEGADPERDREVIYRFSYCHELCTRIAQLQQCVYDLYRLQLNASDFVVPECLSKSSTHISLLRLWGEEQKKKKTDYEELVLYILNCAAANRYRKRESIVYQEKFVEYAGKRYGTRAWEPAKFETLRSEAQASTIEAFIHCACRKEIRCDMWSRLLNMKTTVPLEKYLSTCEDQEFPFLKPCRNLLAFRNGIYDTRGGVGGAFYDYSIVGIHLHGDLVAAKYFNQNLDPQWIATAHSSSWWDIPTPFFQSILDYQNWGVPLQKRSKDGEDVREVDRYAADVRRVFAQTADDIDAILYALQQDDEGAAPRAMEHVLEACKNCVSKAEEAAKCVKEKIVDKEPAETSCGGPNMPRSAGSAFPIEVQRWVYVFLGRMLHALGDFDNWQIIPFFKGRGGSGKSTVGHVAQNFFAAEDVGILSNNSEKKFGLQSLVDKLVFICLELKKNISLEQAEFQSMVSGEEICVAIKNETARVVRWRSPGLLCGNEAPGWVDAQGSIARRLAIFGFKFGISEKHSNPDLQRRIEEEELAAIIVKCNEAYRDVAARHRGEDIWRILPSYFKDERLSLQRDTDPLCAIIWDDAMFELASRHGVPCKEYYMPFEEFEMEYKRRHRDLRGNIPADPLSPDKIAQPFSEAGIEVLKPCTKMYNNSLRTERFLIGIRPKKRVAVSGNDDLMLD